MRITVILLLTILISCTSVQKFQRSTTAILSSYVVQVAVRAEDAYEVVNILNTTGGSSGAEWLQASAGGMNVLRIRFEQMKEKRIDLLRKRLMDVSGVRDVQVARG